VPAIGAQGGDLRIQMPRPLTGLILASASLSLGDCRKRSYRIAPDCCLASRRGSRRIASYVTADATPKPDEKTSKMVFSLTEIALVHGAESQKSASVAIHLPTPPRRSPPP
jgi:hypothetical protein